MVSSREVNRLASGFAAFFFLPLALSTDGFLEDEVHFLISSRERAELLALEREEDRERFIEAFWARRDPTPGTIVNEAREDQERRLAQSDALFREGAFRGRHSERGRVHQLLGPPRFRESFDSSAVVPLELWHYAGVQSRFLPESFYLVFFRPAGDTRFRLYRPALDGVGALLREGEPGRHVLQARLPEIAGIDLELATAIESLAPGGESASLRLLASLDALPELLDRDRRERASVRSEASFGRIPARLEAILLYDDAWVPEIHYALELAPEATKALLAGHEKRFTLSGALLGPSGELDRWEDTLRVEIAEGTLEPGILSFQGRRLAPAFADRAEVTLVDERGESAFATARVSRLLLVRAVRKLEDPDQDLPFRVGDRLLSPIAGDAIVDRNAFAVAQLGEGEQDVVWELFRGERILWRERGPSNGDDATRELPLSTLEVGWYRLVARGAESGSERAFEWIPGEPEADRVRVLSRERTPREEASYRRARASSFSNRGESARALKELARASAALPNDVRLQLELASFRYGSGLHDEVVRQLSSLRTAFPEEVDLLVLLGASLEALDRIEEAEAIYEEAVVLSPGNEALRESRDRTREKLSAREPRRDR
jgi:GWxTD domain-containing protein